MLARIPAVCGILIRMETGYTMPGIDATAFFGGIPGDIPVAGSWDGSGIGKVGIFRSGYWFVDWNGNGAWDAVDAQHIGYFGANPGDYSGSR